MKLKIGELAKMANCQVVTIRYYEKEGLLTKPERTESNYRMYSEEDVDRLRFVRHCRRHGMKLSEIRELLAFRDHPKADCGWINSLVEAHIKDVKDQIESLVLLQEQLEQLLHKCSGTSRERCGIIESLEAACPYCEDFRCRHERAANENRAEQL